MIERLTWREREGGGGTISTLMDGKDIKKD